METQKTFFSRLKDGFSRLIGGPEEPMWTRNEIPYSDHPADRPASPRPPPEFRIARARESVIDLAAKTRELKDMRRFLKQEARDGVKLPVVKWHDGSTLDLAQVNEKLRIRSGCSRAWNLAYAFARGKPYRKVEQESRTRVSPITIAECLAEVTLVPGITSPNPSGEIHYYSARNSPQTMEYMTALAERVQKWYDAEGPAPAGTPVV